VTWAFTFSQERHARIASIALQVVSEVKTVMFRKPTPSKSRSVHLYGPLFGAKEDTDVAVLKLGSGAGITRFDALLSRMVQVPEDWLMSAPWRWRCGVDPSPAPYTQVNARERG